MPRQLPVKCGVIDRGLTQAAKPSAAKDPDLPNYLSRLHYHTMYVPTILERIQKTAPPDADLTSWRY
jgi:hypothetical protein